MTKLPKLRQNFEQLIEEDISVSIHPRNIKTLAIENPKVTIGFSPETSIFNFQITIKKRIPLTPMLHI